MWYNLHSISRSSNLCANTTYRECKMLQKQCPVDVWVYEILPISRLYDTKPLLKYNLVLRHGMTTVQSQLLVKFKDFCPVGLKCSTLKPPFTGIQWGLTNLFQQRDIIYASYQHLIWSACPQYGINPMGQAQCAFDISIILVLAGQTDSAICYSLLRSTSRVFLRHE